MLTQLLTLALSATMSCMNSGFVLLVDESGSMDKYKTDVQKIIDSVKKADKILLFGDRKVHEFKGKYKPFGNTNVFDAIIYAQNTYHPRVLFIISDMGQDNGSRADALDTSIFDGTEVYIMKPPGNDDDK